MFRRAVLDLATSERRSAHFDPRVMVGLPGDHAIGWDPHGGAEDLSSRTDVLAALIQRVRGDHPAQPMIWLTRPGDCEETWDSDLAWGAAAHAALGEAGLPAVFVVVSRHGWFDPFTGAGRRWVRARVRSS